MIVEDGYFRVHQLTQRFGGILALDDLSLSTSRGEIYGVIGPNGAGKTTLLNCICGVYTPSSGTMTLGGDDLTGLRPHRIAEAGVGRTFQAADFFGDCTVVEFLLMSRLQHQTTSLFATMLGLPNARRSERAEHERARGMLTRFGLSNMGDRRVGGLPYGTRKLVDICRALMMEPRLLLMDEPTSGTAVADRDVLRGVVEQLRADGLTTVIVDHDVVFMSDVCDRLLAMNFGKSLAVGTPKEVLARHDVIEAYVGLETV